ncbi:MAG: hypothetical protein KZQ93_08745 [Candidatus Thiodiazotropha sp. (ex Monitilora ramsayi)]|nr:hypothetical protein [Candidatus Thiodiazotropha sp. (ex Monitilora ramsayi)]
MVIPDRVDAVNQNRLYKWTFYRGARTIDPKNKIADLYLSFSLDDLITCESSLRIALDQERERLACKALYQIGMDSFDVAGDQLPWLFVEEGKDFYGVARDNKVIVFGAVEKEYILDDTDSLILLRKYFGLPNPKKSLTSSH